MITTSQEIIGNNSLKSNLIYLNRDLYDKEILPKEYYSYYADLWRVNYFYGKVDTHNNAVFPSEKFLKPLPDNDGKRYLALDFVVDAFNDFKKYYESLCLANRQNVNSNYFLMFPKKAYESTHESYDLYIKSIAKTFYESKLGVPSIEKKIIGFQDFLKLFLEFLDKRTGLVSINRSTFITSLFSSPLISGLMIEVASSYRYDDDALKINAFINDSNFDSFLDAAKRHGFMVDKNVPWRLIADIDSQPMLTYMKRYGINNKEELFKKRFYKAFYTDIEVLKIFVKQIYNSYVSSTPITFVDKLSQCDKIIIETFEKKKINFDQLEEYCNDYYFNRMYTFIRAKENLKKWDQNTFNKIVSNSNEILKYKGKESSLIYINSQFIDLENLILQKSSLTDKNPDVILQIKQQFQQPVGFKF